MSRILSRYFSTAIIFDLLLLLGLGALAFYAKETGVGFISVPTGNAIHNVQVALITISATLIGFLLTVITLIVAFKGGYDESVEKKETEARKELDKLKDVDYKEIPTKTHFEQKFSKVGQFYGSPLFNQVLNTLMNAIFEMGLVLFLILGLHLRWFNLSDYVTSLAGFFSLVLVFLASTRSLIVFKAYLNVYKVSE